jgi:hypothetical protein
MNEKRREATVGRGEMEITGEREMKKKKERTIVAG